MYDAESTMTSRPYWGPSPSHDQLISRKLNRPAAELRNYWDESAKPCKTTALPKLTVWYLIARERLGRWKWNNLQLCSPSNIERYIPCNTTALPKLNAWYFTALYRLWHWSMTQKKQSLTTLWRLRHWKCKTLQQFSAFDRPPSRTHV